MFEQAGNEFGVPPEVLASIAFNSTHWENVTWPTTEADPHFAPHQFGVMGLWENDTFGHELTDAAQLIGKSVDDVRNDPMQNIRAAAALLKSYYQQVAQPEGTAAGDIESWRNAIAKFSGYPERDTGQRFSLGVYEQIVHGDKDHGWMPRAVNLDAIQQAVDKIQEEEAKKRQAKELAEQNPQPTPVPSTHTDPRASLKEKIAAISSDQPKQQTDAAATVADVSSPPTARSPMVLGGIAAAGVLLALFVFRAKKR